jgi:hypothetical protein
MARTFKNLPQDYVFDREVKSKALRYAAAVAFQ